MLTQFYDIEDRTVDVIVENIGGAAKSSDATRFLHFHLSKREPNGCSPSSSEEELSPERTPPRKSTRTKRQPPSPEKEPLTDLQRYFVPDLVM